MSVDSEKASEFKLLAEIMEVRAELIRELEEVQRREKLLRKLIGILEALAVSKSIMTADQMLLERPEKQAIPVEKAGMQLGKIIRYENMLVFTPSEGIALRVDSEPIRGFLVAKVLYPMREEDIRKAKRGEIEHRQVVDWKIEGERGILRRIVVYNLRDERSLKRVLNAIKRAVIDASS
ncbi:MAG: hypothetical protein DRN96_03535 [Thermoproteota archaeon]|nr:MAG: hypothetical protein DRN96_03535 [Candidatus Korarchaeota archaeon]